MAGVNDYEELLLEEEKSDIFKGHHEIQECRQGEGEVDLDTYKKTCKKSHTGYLPIKKLTVEHLPSGCFDEDIVRLIKSIADLTVRVSVKYTSLDRPEFIPGSEDPYPCYKDRGCISLKAGTGMVLYVNQYAEADGVSCPCSKCKNSKTPSKAWGEVEVLTATHVVFDDSEAAQSRCRLWYDDDKSPLVNLEGWMVDPWGSDVMGDWRTLFYVTHDLHVVDKLKQMLSCFVEMKEKIDKKYKDLQDDIRLTVIVSHPHGCAKQVSIGQWLHRELVYENTRYAYKICTCPGSSGAMVYRIGGGWPGHPHSGGNVEYNFSGLYVDMSL